MPSGNPSAAVARWEAETESPNLKASQPAHTLRTTKRQREKVRIDLHVCMTRRQVHIHSHIHRSKNLKIHSQVLKYVELWGV